MCMCQAALCLVVFDRAGLGWAGLRVTMPNESSHPENNLQTFMRQTVARAKRARAQKAETQTMTIKILALAPISVLLAVGVLSAILWL